MNRAHENYITYLIGGLHAQSFEECFAEVNGTGCSEVSGNLLFSVLCECINFRIQINCHWFLPAFISHVGRIIIWRWRGIRCKEVL